MTNQVRVIGGCWRGRKLRFPDVPGLRPTPDRVRETLFNWLQFDVVGARCLDLFAGSGALGLEAASRDAAEVVAVEENPRAFRGLQENVRLLEAEDRVLVIRSDVLKFLSRQGRAFDVVFLDPPFGKGLATPVCRALEAGGWLSVRARIYVEAEAKLALQDLPGNWIELKNKKAGEVGYHLFRREVA